MTTSLSQKDIFLSIKNHNDLARFFGYVSYDLLCKVIYKTDEKYKYIEFTIPKKNGGFRLIKSPCLKLKKIQQKLKDVLYEIYPTKKSAHGFCKNKSIVTNAKSHLLKKYIFNIDLEDYFSSIHFGRVKNLFQSNVFNFNHEVSTILSQICCINNSLPQGAPTSPIISNMISWKLDNQLQHLAKKLNATYTRYADDITFSFTCSKNALPKSIILINSDHTICPSEELSLIIKNNGFNINYSKIRLSNKSSRMEITGLIVNEKINRDVLPVI